MYKAKYNVMWNKEIYGALGNHSYKLNYLQNPGTMMAAWASLAAATSVVNNEPHLCPLTPYNHT